MSNSSLVQYTKKSPNHSGLRNQKITKIAIHHMAGNTTAQVVGNMFAKKSIATSSNYGIGNDGTIALYVDEKNRAWTTSSSWCDNRAVTIEVANNTNKSPWTVSDKVLDRLIELVTDICKRNGIYPVTYTGDKNGTLQKHEWYANTVCPGPYLGSKFQYIADEVNKRLKPSTSTTGSAAGGRTLYKVQVGAFTVKSNADNLLKELKNKGYSDAYITTSTIRKSLTEVAKDVINGDYGNGQARKDKLKAEGYDYDLVQAEVNKLL